MRRAELASLASVGALSLGCNLIFGIEELRPRADLDADQSDRPTVPGADAGPPAADARGPVESDRAPFTDARPEAAAVALEAGWESSTEGADSAAVADSGAESTGDATDGSFAADAAVDGEAHPKCESALWPDLPPKQAATSDGGDIDFVVAMKTIDLGDTLGPSGPSYRTIGFDLDQRCTVANVGPSSCRTPDWATDRGDGELGIDNAMGLFFNGARELLSQGPSESYNQLISMGVASVLLRVREYDGTPNDSRVELGFYTPGPRLSPAYQPIPPAWDGEDAWPILDESLEARALADGGTARDLDRPLAVDSYAYVTDGVLVANVPSASLRVPSPIVGPPGQMIIRISGAVVVGRIEKTAGAWEIHDATLAGRWRIQDLLSQMSQFPSRVDNSKRTPLCTNIGDYGKWKEDFCSLVDILAGHGTVNTPCDALSVGIRFDTGAARLGPVIPTPPQPVRCAPEFDPAGDSCGP